MTWNQSLSGIASYEIEEFTWHPTNADTVWVGTGNGPFVSTDSGKSWSSRRTGMPSATAESNSFTASVQKILVTPGNPSRLLAVLGTKRNHAGGALKNSGHVYVSNDSGTGWSKLSEIIPGVVDNSANVHTAAYTSEPLSTTILAVVSNHGVFKSRDSGETWSAANGGLPAESDGQVAADHLAVHPHDASIAWVSMGAGRGLYKTTDGGTSWSAINSGLDLNGRYSYVAVSKSEPDKLFTIGYDNRRLYRSINGGSSWSEVDSPQSDAFDFGYQGGEVEFDPVDASRVYAGTWVSIFRSKDGGNTFHDLSSFEPDKAKKGYWRGRGFSGYVGTNFRWNPVDTTQCYLMAMDEGFWTSTDSMRTWRRGSANGLPAFGGYSDLTFSADGKIAYLTRGQGGWYLGHSIHRSTDSGVSWEDAGWPEGLSKTSSAVPEGIYCDPSRPTDVWVTIGGRLYVTRDSGTSWSLHPLDDASTNYGANLKWIEPRGGGNGREFFLSGNRGIYWTTDGENFKLIPGSPANWLYGDTRLHVDPLNTDRLYAVNRGYFQGADGLWQGNLSGSDWSWKRIAGWGFITPDIQYVSDIAINPANSDQAMLTTRKDPFDDSPDATGVWVTSNLISPNPIWKQSNEGLGMNRIMSARFMPGKSGIVVIGTMGGGYYIARWDGTRIDTGHGIIPPDVP